MHPLDRLIECQVDNCKQPFESTERFENHLRLAHRMSLEAYKKRFPNVRTEVLSTEPEKLMDQAVRLEKSARDGLLEPERKFKLEDITDVDYFKQALEKHYPEKYKFFMASRHKYMDAGIPECSALDQLAFMDVLLRDNYLSIIATPDKHGQFDVTSEHVDILKKISETFQNSIKSIKSVFEQKQQEENIATKLEALMTDADTAIRQSLGEQLFKCRKCGAMINTSGFEHWAFEILKDAGDKKLYLLWNSELWEMVKGIKTTDAYGQEHHWQTPIWVMAFVLETSIEGLMFTAKHRKMNVDKFEKGGKKWGKIEGFEFDIGFHEEQSRLALDFFKKEYHNK